MRVKTTSNKSFLNAWHMLQDLGCNDPMCMLELGNPNAKLPMETPKEYDYDNNLISDQRKIVSNEILTNIWFYFREFVRIPQLGDPYGVNLEMYDCGTPYILTDCGELLSLIMIRAYSLHLNVIFCVDPTKKRKNTLYDHLTSHLTQTAVLLENYDMLSGHDIGINIVTESLLDSINSYMVPHYDYSKFFPQSASLSESELLIKNTINIPGKNDSGHISLLNRITDMEKDFHYYLHYDKFNSISHEDVHNLFYMFLNLHHLQNRSLYYNETKNTSVIGIITTQLLSEFKKYDLSSIWEFDHIKYIESGIYDNITKHKSSSNPDTEPDNVSYHMFIRELFSEEYSNDIITTKDKNSVVFIKI